MEINTGAIVGAVKGAADLFKVKQKWDVSKLRYKLFEHFQIEAQGFPHKDFNSAYKYNLVDFSISNDYSEDQVNFFSDELVIKQVYNYLYTPDYNDISKLKKVIQAYCNEINLGTCFYPVSSPEDEFERFCALFKENITKSRDVHDAEEHQILLKSLSIVTEIHKILDKPSKTPEELISLAQPFFDSEDYESALLFYRKALIEDPENSDALLNKATCLFKLRKIDDCQRTLDKLLYFGSLMPKPYQLRGHVYFDKKMYGYALREIDQAIEINDQIHEASQRVEQEKNFQIKGMILQAQEHYAEALACYNEAIKIKPSYSSAINNRGLCFKELKQYENALKDFDYLIDEQGLVDHQYYNNRGTVYEEKDDLESAEKDYLKALELLEAVSKKDVKILVNMSILYSRMGRFEEAMKLLSEAEKLDPGEHLIYFNKGVIFYERGEFEESLKQYEIARTLKPNDNLLQHNIAMLLFVQGQFEVAEFEINKIVEAKRDAEFYYSIGTVQLKRGKFLPYKFYEAIENFTKAIELKPDWIDAYLNRCNALRFTRQFDKAEADAKRLIELAPTADHYNTLGGVLVSSGQFEAGQGVFLRAIGIDSDCAFAYANIATVFLKEFNLLDAKDFIELALSISPNDNDILSTKAVILILLGSIKEAENILLEIERHDPKHVDALRHLHQLYHNKQQKDKENEYFAKLRQLVPDYKPEFSEGGEGRVSVL